MIGNRFRLYGYAFFAYIFSDGLFFSGPTSPLVRYGRAAFSDGLFLSGLAVAGPPTRPLVRYGRAALG